jgi:hypothetical protein
VTSTDLDRTELDILITCVDRQLARYDETWGDAKWCREQKIKKTDPFHIKQAEARARAGNLLKRLETERGV